MTLRAVTIGDSIAWGQGLLEDQKFDRRAVAEMAARQGLPDGDWEIDRRARSGAVIKEEDTEAPLDPSRHPAWREVPWGSPTALQQLDGAPDPGVDLVIAVAGLNDFGITSVLTPDIDRADLEADIRRNCYVDAKAMVRRARDRFPNAIIVLGGYFAPFSDASGVTMIRAIASGLGPSRLITEATTRRVARQAQLFARRQLYWLRLVVAERQGDPATRGPGIVFAHPAFGPLNSVGAPEALLFSPDPPEDIEEWGARLVRDPLAAGLRLHPDDPMSEDRRAACEIYRDRVQDHPVDSAPLQCRIAAIGHPDPDGAARYRDAVLSAWERARRITLRDDLDRQAIHDAARQMAA